MFARALVLIFGLIFDTLALLFAPEYAPWTLTALLTIVALALPFIPDEWCQVEEQKGAITEKCKHEQDGEGE